MSRAVTVLSLLLQGKQHVFCASSLVNSEEDMLSLTNDAIDLAETGDMVGALELFRQAAAKAPKSGKVWENLGVTFLRLGRLDEARESLERSRGLLSPSDRSLQDNFAALEEYEEFMRQHPDAIAGVSDDWDGDSSESIALTNEAIALAQAGKEEDALGLFEQAVDAYPSDPKMWENLAVTFMRLNKLDRARYSFEAAVARSKSGFSPTLQDNLDALGQHLTAQGAGKPTKRPSRPSGVKADPPSSIGTAMTADAISRAESGDVLGALPLFEQAVAQDPSSGQSYLNLGVTQESCRANAMQLMLMLNHGRQ